MTPLEILEEIYKTKSYDYVQGLLAGVQGSVLILQKELEKASNKN
ncbi:hypothetical protein STRDD10_01613 [Streptococcus sp. DD10]|nr:hypothetical protein [Streptococcus sp. DD10]KXT73138.1 hypothetical protein STRDD10_01613 [Streptococcus sp. DD10]